MCRLFEVSKYPLKNTGSLFVVIGDKYFTKKPGSGGKSRKQLTNDASFFKSYYLPGLLPDGSLMNLPNRFAIRMVDGFNWILKHTIIWNKPNAFTTSNKKKFTLDFEYIFHFVKDAKKY